MVTAGWMDFTNSIHNIEKQRFVRTYWEPSTWVRTGALSPVILFAVMALLRAAKRAKALLFALTANFKRDANATRENAATATANSSLEVSGVPLLESPDSARWVSAYPQIVTATPVPALGEDTLSMCLARSMALMSVS